MPTCGHIGIQTPKHLRSIVVQQFQIRRFFANFAVCKKTPDMRFAKLHLLGLCALAAATSVSCKKDVQVGQQTIPLVERILSGDERYNLQLMGLYREKSAEGAIAVVGNYSDCEVYAQQLLECDFFDNIDGSRKRDGLADFAGEKIVAYIDQANADFGGYARHENTSLLREITVRDFLMAADTACSIAAFDTLKMDKQPRAKIVILASPHMAEYGKFDVDTLTRSTKAFIKVISPIELVKERGGFIGVITDSTTCKSGIYEKVLDRATSHSAIQSFENDSTNVLKSFIDHYRTNGGEKQISTIVMDADQFEPARLRRELKEIMTVQSESNVASRKFISPDIQFIWLSELVAQECFRYMREENIFTHYIAKPSFAAYETIPVKGLDPLCYDSFTRFKDEYRYTRKDAADYTVVESAISIDYYVSN